MGSEMKRGDALQMGWFLKTVPNQPAGHGFHMATSEIPGQIGYFTAVTHQMKLLKIMCMQGSYEGIFRRQILCI